MISNQTQMKSDICTMESSADESSSAATTASDGLRKPICPDCDTRLSLDGPDANCPDCGEIFDQGADNVYADSVELHRDTPGKTVKRASRTKPRYHDDDLGSEIGHSVGTPANASHKLRRLRERDAESKFDTGKKKATADGLAEVRRLCSQLDVDETIFDRGQALFREAHGNDLAVGYSLDHLAAAVVIAALRDCERPVMMQRVLEETHVDRRNVYLLLQDVYSETNAEPLPLDPLDHLPRLASAVDAPSKVERLAYDLTVVAQQKNIHTGTKPASVPGAALYFAAALFFEDISQADVAAAAGTTRQTIHNRYDDLQEADALSEAFNRHAARTPE